jgi:DNA-binding winged helix-turn-helix (wHTH) protein/tetratricopeptide (TPR) repeat protein
MIYVFENFELDIRKQQLRGDGQDIRVEPQVFDLLCLLIQNHDRLVSKDEIIDTVWNGRAISDTAVSSRISAARTALNDDGKQQRLIKTVHNKGLRFIGEPIVKDEQSSQRPKPSPILEGQPRIIVMPFRARPDNDMELFTADALVDEISALLTSVESLTIIPRYAAGLSLPIDTDPIALAQDLGAQYVVTGHVRRENQRLRVRVILTDLSDLKTLWSEKFDGTMEDIFAIEDKVCTAVIGALGGKIAHIGALRAARSKPDNLQAWELTRLALSTALDWRPITMQGSVNACRRALELDPNYAHAHAYLAFFLAWQIAQGWAEDPEKNRRDAQHHVELARRLTRHDAEVLSAIGDTYRTLGDPKRAVEFYESCIAAKPDAFLAWPVALPIIGIAYAQIGRDADARAYVAAFEDKFLGDDMGRIWSRIALGYIELCSRNYDRVIELHANPPSEYNAICRIIALLATEQRDLARAEWQGLATANPKLSHAHYVTHFKTYPIDKNLGEEFSDHLSTLLN